jgi:hypothetical protein
MNSEIRFRVVSPTGDVGVIGRVSKLPRDIEDFSFLTVNGDFGIDPSSGYYDIEVLDGGTWRPL